MKQHHPLYDPPLTSDSLAEYRTSLFNGQDQELFLHIGHFNVWYGTAEFALTMLLHAFSGGGHPPLFHALTRGMDGKIKVERLKALMKIHGWKLEPGLEKRFEHFLVIIGIRNGLAHSHFYWPAGGDLQLTSLGEPPIFDDVKFAAPAPKTYSGLELFERGVWLGAFAHDLIAVREAVPNPIPK